MKPMKSFPLHSCNDPASYFFTSLALFNLHQMCLECGITNRIAYKQVETTEPMSVHQKNPHPINTIEHANIKTRT